MFTIRNVPPLNYMYWHVFFHVKQSHLISWYLNEMPWNTARYTDVIYNFWNRILSPFFSYHHALYTTCKLIWVVPICREYGVRPKHPVLTSILKSGRSNLVFSRMSLLGVLLKISEAFIRHTSIIKLQKNFQYFLDDLPTGFLARCCIHLSTPLMYFW